MWKSRPKSSKRLERKTRRRRISSRRMLKGKAKTSKNKQVADLGSKRRLLEARFVGKREMTLT